MHTDGNISPSKYSPSHDLQLPETSSQSPNTRRKFEGKILTRLLLNKADIFIYLQLKYKSAHSAWFSTLVETRIKHSSHTLYLKQFYHI